MVGLTWMVKGPPLWRPAPSTWLPYSPSSCCRQAGRQAGRQRLRQAWRLESASGSQDSASPFAAAPPPARTHADTHQVAGHQQLDGGQVLELVAGGHVACRREGMAVDATTERTGGGTERGGGVQRARGSGSSRAARRPHTVRHARLVRRRPVLLGLILAGRVHGAPLCRGGAVGAALAPAGCLLGRCRLLAGGSAGSRTDPTAGRRRPASRACRPPRASGRGSCLAARG
jgi:hypothetical protein